METEIEKYRSSVTKLAENKSTLVFNNHGPEFACIVASTIFNNSKKVNIFTKSMKGTFSSTDEYISSVSRFINKGGTLNIIVSDGEQLEQGQSKFLSRLKEYNSDLTNKIVLKKLNKGIDSQSVYFMTGDEEKFRIQTNNANYEALVCFNNIETSQKLNSYFVWLNANSSEILKEQEG